MTSPAPAQPSVQGSILGHAVLRREDPSLLRGEDRFVDDLHPRHVSDFDQPALAVVFVRSVLAHAIITGVDTTWAVDMPGVRAVYTAETLDVADFAPMGPAMPARPALAKGRVRYVGDIVAMVIADSHREAVDAAEHVVIDYEPLPVVTDAVAALAPDAPVLFPDREVPEGAPANAVFAIGIGAETDPLVDAEHITEVEMISPRQAGVPMEPNGALAIPALPDTNGDGPIVTLWAPSQNPVDVRGALARHLGIEPTQMRVAAPAVGGGFGPKAGPYTEYLLVCRAAMELGLPLKWTEERSENMVSMAHGRDMVLRAKLGLRRDGTITGIGIDVVANAGAYPATGAILPMFTQTMSQGVYQIPRLRFNAVSAATNTTHTGAYRGAGRPEATQLLERVLDKAAAELGLDPADIRRRNFIPPEAFPLTTHGGANYDSGEYALALDRALEIADYAELRAEQQRRRAAGDPRALGIGVASYVEVTAPAGLHVEYGAVEINADGTVTARVGTSAHGQGHITAFSMILSERLGVPLDAITILQSDTDDIPRGSGTMGSRSLQTAGSAVHVAAGEVLEQGRELMAHLLEANPTDVVVADGGLQIAGVPQSKLSWAELAQAAADPDRRPAEMGERLAFELDFDGTDSTYPFGTHISVVEVDTDTGDVTMLRHIAVDDCGRILNPMLVTGQQHGGIAQGAAQALFEQVRYDADGNPQTSNLMDYAMPSAAELINFDTANTETPSPRNPLGAKGIGESGTIGATPAIHNAVVDAVAHLGVSHIDMPLTSLTVWRAIHAANA